MVQNYPRVILKHGSVTLSTNEIDVKDSQEPRPNGFCVNMPLEYGFPTRMHQETKGNP